ncbi:DUF2867 domain-containing protein [Solidesulfovibrio sp.]|uniref:DUF2867 domain-containing protein n=1 Tax=Solidesulfovibrio sp. TaxID=2910990 RepID=UPI00262B63E7|nr:DUF2867 domain-containing protein [Solidesulfovibrio sp.]
MAGEREALAALQRIAAVAGVVADADHVDVHRVRGQAGLRQFVAAMFGDRPTWLRALYRLRGLLARLLGLRHGAAAGPESMKPEDVPMTPGGKLGFFTVLAAEPDAYWAAGATDRHLRAVLAVLAVPEPDGRVVYDVVTVVVYKHWTGPVYFNLIRPFHHLVVWRMAKRAARGRNIP